MSFLSDVWGDIAGPGEVDEAIIEAVCAAIIADSEVTDQEIGYAIGFVESLLGTDEGRASELVDKAIARVQGRDIAGLLADISTRLGDDHHREGAFVVVFAAMCVDGFVSYDEETLLQSMAVAFSISAERAGELLVDAEQQILKEPRA